MGDFKYFDSTGLYLPSRRLLTPPSLYPTYDNNLFLSNYNDIDLTDTVVGSSSYLVDEALGNRNNKNAKKPLQRKSIYDKPSEAKPLKLAKTGRLSPILLDKKNLNSNAYQTSSLRLPNRYPKGFSYEDDIDSILDNTYRLSLDDLNDRKKFLGSLLDSNGNDRLGGKPNTRVPPLQFNQNTDRHKEAQDRRNKDAQKQPILRNDSDIFTNKLDRTVAKLQTKPQPELVKQFKPVHINYNKPREYETSNSRSEDYSNKSLRLNDKPIKNNQAPKQPQKINQQPQDNFRQPNQFINGGGQNGKNEFMTDFLNSLEDANGRNNNNHNDAEVTTVSSILSSENQSPVVNKKKGAPYNDYEKGDGNRQYSREDESRTPINQNKYDPVGDYPPRRQSYPDYDFQRNFEDFASHEAMYKLESLKRIKPIQVVGDIAYGKDSVPHESNKQKFEKDQKRKYYANLVKERNDQILSNGLPSERSRRETSYDKQKKNKAILYETRKDYARAVKETNDERFEKKKQKNSIDRLRDFEKRGEEIVKQKENKIQNVRKQTQYAEYVKERNQVLITDQRIQKAEHKPRPISEENAAHKKKKRVTILDPNSYAQTHYNSYFQEHKEHLVKPDKPVSQ